MVDEEDRGGIFPHALLKKGPMIVAR